MNGIDFRFIQDREDEIAVMITAIDHVDRLRTLARMLHERKKISSAYYKDTMETLDLIDGALVAGKHNTAALRNGRRQ